MAGIVTKCLCYLMILISSSVFFFPNVSYRKAQDQQKKVVLAGCVPQAQPRMDYLKGLSIIGVCICMCVCTWTYLSDSGDLSNVGIRSCNIYCPFVGLY